MKILEELVLLQRVWRAFLHLVWSGQNYSLSWLQTTITMHELLLFGNYDIGMKHYRIGMKYFLGAATDSSGLVRMEAAIAASWIGTQEALDAVLSIFRQPIGGHLAYAAVCALESSPLQRHWRNDQDSIAPALLNRARRSLEIKEPKAKGKDREFDRSPETVEVRISCEPERMLFTNKQFTVRPGQPVKLVFLNPDATDHNLVLVKPGAMEEVGVAANAMARDPKNATSDFIPEDKQNLILEATPMIGPTRESLVHVLRFEAPQEPGVYPYVCTFPGHWIVMNGKMVVARDQMEAERLLDACRPTLVQVWKVEDFPTVATSRDEATLSRGHARFCKSAVYSMSCHGRPRCKLRSKPGDERKEASWKRPPCTNS